ncbi:hypothetical protein [Oceanispirochaeta sp.]|nr:hypothetical protein [Oceanispirochaeta sp.]MDA3956675.1 hypothetical protein [Oceanispirochaeta sp.]
MSYSEAIDSVVSINILFGFNWRVIDGIHFEYRPEILILNGFK